MLPKKKRVTKEAFQVLIKEGKTFSCPVFLFHFKPSNLPQYAFVCPKKSFKNAVLRNKYRRLGYNILREVPLEKGSGIFIYKKQALSSTKQEISDSIVFTLKKVGFLIE